MHDPLPGQALLTAGEVAKLLSMEHRTFLRFLKEENGFPLPLDIAPVGSRRKRLKWRKDEILEWIIRRPRGPAHSGG